jgi:mannosyltransferase
MRRPISGKAAATFAAPAALMLVVALYGATNRGTWQNEYVAWYAIRLNFTDQLRLLGVIDAVKAASFMPMHLWTSAVGDSTLSMRLPSIVAIALAAGATALIAKHLFDTTTGIVAGLLFTAIPSMSRYGQEMQPYGWTVAAVTVSTAVLLRALERPTKAIWVLYTIAAIAAGWTHIVGLSIVGVHWLLYLRTAMREDRKMPAWPIAALAVISAVVPIMLWGSQQSGAISWIKAGPQQLRAMPTDLFMSTTIAYTVYGLAVLGLTLSFARRQDRITAGVMLAWAVLPPVFGFSTFAWLHMFLPRYFLFTVPAWVILASSALTAIPARNWAVRATRISLATFAVAGVAGAGIPDQEAVRATPVVDRPDLRGPALAVLRQQQPGDGIAYGGEASKSYIRQAVAFETRGHAMPADVFLMISGRELGWYLSKECIYPDSCASGYRRIWLITTATPKDPTTELYKPKATVLRTQFTITSIQQFAGARVVLLVRNPVSRSSDASRGGA